MTASIRNQTLVAAAVAKQQGFENTYNALIEIVRSLNDSTDVHAPYADCKTEGVTLRQLEGELWIR